MRCCPFASIYDQNWLVSAVVQDIAIGAEGVGSIPGPVKSDTVSLPARHRCDVSSELCCRGARMRRWAPLATRFSVLQ